MSSAQAPPGAQVDVTSLSLPQLQQVRQQLEQELSHLTSSYAQLKAAQSRFRSSVEALNVLSKTDEDKNETLVPLTSSLYVKGKLSETKSVIVDVGTGYFVEKAIPSALTLYKDKISYITKNLETLQDTITKKEDNMRVVRDIMAMKAQEMQAAQQQQQGGKVAQGASKGGKDVDA